MTTSVQLQGLAGVLKNFQLRNIWLHSAHFTRPNDPPDEPEVDVVQQSKRSVSVARKDLDESGDAKELLFVVVALGTRVKAQPESDPTIYFEIEADFVAQYELTDRVADDLVQQFAEFNAVHNVWPFWRQHVFDIVQRAYLPHVDIPLFSGNPPADPSAGGAKPMSHPG